MSPSIHIYIHRSRSRDAKARDHWLTYKRLGDGYLIMEGAGVNGGQFALVKNNQVLFKSGKLDEVEHEYAGGYAQDRKARDAGRLIQTFTDKGNTVKVYRDSEWQEFICKLYVQGAYRDKADYHTDDKSDALSTAQAMLRGAV